VHIQRDQPTIWSSVDPPARRKQYLRQHERVVVLLKGTRTEECRWSPQRSPATYVSRCLPNPLQDMEYRAEPGGHEWTFAVLAYRPADT
jgi:hypothetical protein